MRLEIKTNLDKINKFIKVDSTTFILRGVIGYQGTHDPDSLGHFIAYGYRHNDKWISYNDLKKTPECISPNTNVGCVLLFYTV